jgi:hypothetical protein
MQSACTLLYCYLWPLQVGPICSSQKRLGFRNKKVIEYKIRALNFLNNIYLKCGFGCLGVALVPKFTGSNPAEAVGFKKKKKILSTPSFGGEVKPSVPCRKFAACKRSLNDVEVVISAKLPGNILAYTSTFRC